MSTTQLRQAASGQAPAAQAADPKSIMGLMNSDSVKKQMALAMPKHLTADRLMRIAMTEVRKVPALGKCNVQSFMGAIMQCAQLGLEPGAALGHAYLLPFGNGKASDGLANCQLIIGYRGMIDLARRSGQIISLNARAVYSNDQFAYTYGLDETLEHIPATGDRGEFTHVYAVAKLKGGGIQFEVMSKADVLKVKATSKAGNNGPWVSHFDEMAKKTVIRRLFKYLPVSIEVTQAVILDEKADAGVDQDNASAITGEFSVFEEPQQLGVDESLDKETGEITEPKKRQQKRQDPEPEKEPEPRLDQEGADEEFSME
jgi:recombination protein RecT